ncbi:hypothetical protein ACJ6WF_49540 [Streptomyces sp. MMS24-I2-30]|uniref:hypothetical protein n=1 Tax=Streptomyces sp. MMS24-I2-30 TaxID=3351564 RepID=UPI003896C1AA
MITIICAECGTHPFRAQTNGTFKCTGCSSYVATADLVFDEEEQIVTDSSGILGYVRAGEG